jgi:hypothetical protein
VPNDTTATRGSEPLLSRRRLAATLEAKSVPIEHADVPVIPERPSRRSGVLSLGLAVATAIEVADGIASMIDWKPTSHPPAARPASIAFPPVLAISWRDLAYTARLWQLRAAPGTNALKGLSRPATDRGSSSFAGCTHHTVGPRLDERLILRAVTRAKCPQRHGVAQHVHRSDAVLPAVTHSATKQIHRTRLDTREPALPVLADFPAEPQDARCQKRHRGNVLKGWAVAVPADPGARRIFRHHQLFKLIRGCAADLACDLSQSSQVVGDAGVGARLLACKNVFVPKAVDPAVAQVAMKFERFEWQCFKSLYQGLLFRRLENLRHVTKASGQFGLTKQVAHAAISWRDWHVRLRCLF